MSLHNKKEFFTGFVLMIIFLVVLVIFFSPVFNGQNGMEYLDSLYNSISKGSAYYIPSLKEQVAPLQDEDVTLNLKMKNPETAALTAKLFEAGGAQATVSGSEVQAKGSMGHILANVLADADSMYYNEGDKLQAKYGAPAKLIMYDWWFALKESVKSLNKQKLFKLSKVTDTVIKRAVETTYNYYGIEAQKIMDKIGVVIFSLVFYVVYTLWYGFSIMFMFEGWGLRLEH